MTIALIIAILNAFAALVAKVSGHFVLCGFNIAMAIIFTFSAISAEGRILNRIKKLETEIKILKGESTL